MAYYLEIRDNEIKGRSQCEFTGNNITCVQVTEEIYNNCLTYGYDYYAWVNNEVVVNPDWDSIQLEQAKQEKIALNDELRDTALLRGVTYNNVLFDSDTDQKVNLLATVSSMNDDDTITWYGMDNQALLCTKSDLVAIGELITILHGYCWSMNAFIKEQINDAKNISDLENIIIDYQKKEEVNV